MAFNLSRTFLPENTLSLSFVLKTAYEHTALLRKRFYSREVQLYALQKASRMQYAPGKKSITDTWK